MNQKKFVVFSILYLPLVSLIGCKTRNTIGFNTKADLNALGFVASLDKNLQENNITDLQSFLNSESAQASYKNQWLGAWEKSSQLGERYDYVINGLKLDSKKQRASTLNKALFTPMSPRLNTIELKIFADVNRLEMAQKSQFNDRISNFSKRCRADFPDAFHNPVQENLFKNQLLQIVNSYLSSEQMISSWNPTDNAKTRRIKQGNIYKDLSSNEDLKRVGRFFLCQTLAEGDFFSFDQVHEYIDSTGISGAFLAASLDRANTAEMFFPRFDHLFAELIKEIFPVDKSQPASKDKPQKILVLEPSTLPFHMIFKGIELGECVGGGKKDDLTPERLASGALTGSIVYYASLSNAEGEKAIPVGFVQLTPLASQLLPGQNFGVDFGVRELSSMGVYYTAENEFIKGYIFELLMWRLQKEFPSARFFKSDSNAISNAGISSLVSGTKMYSESKNQYPTRGFSHLNPQLAADIVSLPSLALRSP